MPQCRTELHLSANAAPPSSSSGGFTGILSQERLAERLDTSVASVSRIETGRQPYTQDYLEALASALQTDPASLLMRNPDDPEAIWSIWDNAKQGERKKILDMARSIVKTGT